MTPPLALLAKLANDTLVLSVVGMLIHFCVLNPACVPPAYLKFINTMSQSTFIAHQLSVLPMSLRDPRLILHVDFVPPSLFTTDRLTPIHDAIRAATAMP
jgi:hypothetical protein